MVGLEVRRVGVRYATVEGSSCETTKSRADRYERSDGRVTEHNGTRPRCVLTIQTGDVGLRIPKLRKGSFLPVTVEARRRIDQARYAVVMEACVHGSPREAPTMWWKPWASTRGSPSPRCRGSVTACTRRSARMLAALE